MPVLACTGRDGVARTFEYRYSREPLSGEWSVKVTSIPPLPGGDFFEMKLAPIDEETLRVVMVNHFNVPSYVGMGIPDALLPAIKSVLGKNVESSPSYGTRGNVYRTPAATKVWERLRQMRLATYDPARDIYRLA